MDVKEKTELIELIKSDMENIAKSHAEGATGKVTELEKSLEGKIEKSLDGFVTKDAFDKAETELKKAMNLIKDRESKDVSFKAVLADELTKSMDSLKELQKGYDRKGVGIDIRKDPGVFTSADSITGSNTAAGRFAINNNQDIVPIARRQRHVREVLGMGTTDMEVYPYLRETPKEGAVAVQNPEGAPKAQLEYKQTLITATESTIAAFQKIGRQTLSNVRGLGSFLQLVMLNDLLLKEDNDLIFGAGTNGAIDGIFKAGAVSPVNDLPLRTTDANLYDVIAGGAAKLANLEYNASFAMVNPIDYWQMVIEKDKDSRYQNNVIFDSAMSTLYVFGIPTIASTVIPVGNIGMGDSNYVMPLQREGISLRFFDQDEDNVQRNLVTVRVEERILNVVRRTDAFIYGTIASAKAILEST
jgi:hypothetical protein